MLQSVIKLVGKSSTPRQSGKGSKSNEADQKVKQLERANQVSIYEQQSIYLSCLFVGCPEGKR